MFLRVMLIVYVDFNLSIYTWQVQIKNNVLVPMCDIILVWSLHKKLLNQSLHAQLLPVWSQLLLHMLENTEILILGSILITNKLRD